MKKYTYIFSCIILMCAVRAGYAQIRPPGQGQSVFDNQRGDSTQFTKTNTADWKDETYRIYYRKLHSDKVYTPDTGLHSFHRRLVNFPLRDLGNNGSATRNLLFTPDNRTGPTFGYTAYDAYRYDADSLSYYNTNRPYSIFGYQLGGKQEQMTNIMHSQNIKPNWNASAGYRKIISPGFYNIQRTNNDNAFFSTYYQSKKLNYELFGGIAYNRFQQDENGGMVDVKQLDSAAYNDRRTVNVAFRNDAFGNSSNIRRSAVVNLYRDYSFMVQHGYTWGRRDTIYNQDSSRYSLSLTPRFSIVHRVEMSGERRVYKDQRPDSLRYVPFFNKGFAATDSVYSRHEWFFIDNRFLFNGFAGKRENQLHFTTGLGYRNDVFETIYLRGTAKTITNSLYLQASLKKEALLQGKWFYDASIITFLTGNTAGSSNITGQIGKDLGNKLGSVSLSAGQQINAAPYNYNTYYNQYDTILNTFDKESITHLQGQWLNEEYSFNLGVRNYLIGNYIYTDSAQKFSQNSTTFNILQVWARKALHWKIWVLDNELIYQQTANTNPVNVPKLMGRHQLSIETRIFKKALKIATGVEMRYHTGYAPSGYSAFFNRFFYQNSNNITNTPDWSVFFNFKVKRFRAYLMADQMQQLYSRNLLVAKGYAAQNFNIRFGFNWVMIN